MGAPFTENLLTLLAFIVLNSTPTLLFFLCRDVPEWTYSVYILSFFIIESYALTILYVICQLSNKFLRNLCRFIIIIMILYQFLNIITVLCYRSTINWNIIQIVANTNGQEVKEFTIAFILNIRILFPSIIFLMITSALFLTNKLACVCFKCMYILGYICLCFCFLLLLHNSAVINDCYDFSVIRWVFQERIDLRKHLCHPIVIETKENHPRFIVLIIGESFSKTHSSLYGYEKTTNPLLEDLRTAGHLWCYDNVTSPDVGTFGAFEYILNLHREGDGKEWYETPTIAEIFNLAGYTTLWFSNQAQNGLLDNMSSGFSVVCDKTFFTGYPNRNKYDGKLVDFVEGYNFDKNKSYLLFFHLMGQHEGFHERYPESFEIFKKDDYRGGTEEKRKTIARYDNATLYNDYVVRRVFDFFKAEEAICLYFPDHSLDIYESDSTYYGHSTSEKKSQFYGKQIPFMIYTTEKYRSKFIEEQVSIEKNIHRKFNTQDVSFSIMDLTGFAVEGICNKQYSLFQ